MRPPAFVPYLLSADGGFASAEEVVVPYASDEQRPAGPSSFKRRPLVVLTKHAHAYG